MLKILIAEDNYEYLENLFNNINDNITKGIKIVQICNDGEKALNYIMNKEIDVILLDLNIPKVNGIEILEKMKENNIKSKIIIISGETNLIVEIISRKLSVNQILVKPFHLEELINSLNDIISDLFEGEDDIKNNGNKVLELLNEFNFNKSNIGYTYIIDCLQYCIKRKYTFIPHIKDLYRDVAKQYNKISYTNVSWNISKSIQMMNRLTEKNILNKFFPYNNTPSPKTFLNEILNMYYNCS